MKIVNIYNFYIPNILFHSSPDSGQVEFKTSADARHDQSEQGQMGGTEQEETKWPERVCSHQPLRRRRRGDHRLPRAQDGKRPLLRRRRFAI